MLVTVVIPVFNSPVLPELTRRIAAVFANGNDDYEVVFVDDGSTVADVWPTLERLAAAHPAVRAVQLTHNFGQHAATLCGLRESRGDVVVTMDDDLQHDPDDIPLLLECRSRDIVIGQYLDRQHGAVRRLVSRIKWYFDGVLLDRPKTIRLTSFRMLRRSVVDGIVAARVARPFIPALMLNVSRDVVAVPVNHRPRSVGRSGYTVRKQLRIIESLLASNPAAVLRLLGALGVAVGAAGLALSLSPMAFAVALLVSGVLLLGLGVAGKRRPRVVADSDLPLPYVIRRRSTSFDRSGPAP